MPLDPADILAIHQLLALYGHVIDARDWSALDRLFAPDCRYDMSDFGLGVVTGPAAIRDLWVVEEARHPLAHHATNIVVGEPEPGSPNDTVAVTSKGLGVGRGGRVGSVTYHDIVIRTAEGWRFAGRKGVLRRAP